jgi:hypothetical protein
MDNLEQETDITLEHSTTVEKEIQNTVNHYYNDPEEIDLRLMELDEEMDLETYFQTQSAALTISGVILGLTSSKKWLALPLVGSLLVIANFISGSDKPLSYFRKLGFRTRAEIEKERYALKAIRGDFKYLLDVPNAVWNAVNK